MKKLDGTEYEPASLTSFQRSLQRSLNETCSNVNIIEVDIFKLSREVLSAKRRQLVIEHGKGNRPQAARELTEAEEDKLFAECGEFGTSNPTALQRTLWWVIALHFGFRARDESRRLKWGTSLWRKTQKRRMRFMGGDMSEDPKHVKAKTSHTVSYCASNRQ